MRYILPLPIFFLFILIQFSHAQSKEELYIKGLKLKSEYSNREALPIFQSLLKSDSGNVNYLHNTSYMYSKVGNTLNTQEEKINYYRIAEYLARKALYWMKKTLMLIMLMP